MYRLASLMESELGRANDTCGRETQHAGFQTGPTTSKHSRLIRQRDLRNTQLGVNHP